MIRPNDIRLLNEIRKNSRASLTEFATNTDIPLSTVFKKVIRLEKSGVISRHLALIDFEKVGHPFKVGVFLSTNERDELEDYLKEHQSINTLIKLSGTYDYYAEMVFRDMGEYQEFEHAIKNLKIIKRNKIHFLTDVKQEAFKIPIEE
jgi:Lrp/AsnC family leucine-responsive transcriptional regulator